MHQYQVLGFIAASLTTFSFVPQSIKTIRTKNTEGISLWMYIFFTVGLFLWEYYGICTLQWPIIISNIICITLVIPILYLKIKNSFQISKN